MCRAVVANAFNPSTREAEAGGISMKELGVIFYNCSCLVLDLQRIFALYSSLKFKSRVPQTWSKRLYGVYDNEKKLQLQLNETKSQAFVSMKELGVIFYNCSCLVLDLQRIFALYSSLKFKSRVPQTWSKRLYGVYDNEKKLQLQLNETKSQAFVSNSPKLFCPKNRSFDIDAIYSVIDDAKQYVYIAVTDYLPISSTSTKRTYWPDLDGKIREALVLRSVKVRLLISFWKETDPLTFNFISSLKAICTEIANCSLKVKFFDLERENACATKEQKNQTFPKLNRNKYMVTDGAAYIGNFDWVGNDFTQNAGTGLVINQADARDNRSIIKQLKDVFERDWYSPYAKSLQPTKQPNCSNLSKRKSPSSQAANDNATEREPLSA
ncbi:Inactive phospholipase D5 [Microtus ochrogaster]|uniref:Inactive phospholipase D5 n=1 Tax=Microtus ochrogaster TaxID=79684 RepID=A0A8J6GHA1_MICOH|nr:Inactive phospholipase D5 [Microtus ochrogaster]